MHYLAKLLWWALATGAIWLIYDHTRTIISADVLRAIAATGAVILGSVLGGMIYAGVRGYLRARGG